MRLPGHRQISAMGFPLIWMVTLLLWPSLVAGQTGQLVTEPVFDGTIYLEEFGRENSPTLILVHGAGELGPEAVDVTLPALKDAFHIIRFDLPGFGRSEKKPALYSPDNYARLLKWIIDTHATQPVYLVGHSLGGAIALYFAGAHPQAVARLILVDTAGILNRAAYTKGAFDNFLSGRIHLGDNNLIEKPMSAFKYFVGTAIERVDKNFVAENLDILLGLQTFREKALGGNPVRIAAMALIYTDFGSIIANAKVPTHLIWGERDTTAPLRIGYVLACTLDRASLTVMKNMGHSPMLENPERFNTLLLESLTRADLRPYAKISEPGRAADPLPTKFLYGIEDQEISGQFQSITIKNSKGITISDTYAKQIVIENSEVSLVNTMVAADTTAITISDAIVYFTGVIASGKTTIEAKNSNVDIAGSTLRGSDNLIKSSDTTTVIFSVSKVSSPGRTGNEHRVIILNDGEVL